MKTSRDGGAMYLQSTYFDWYQEFYLENNEFSLNQAGGNGGAIALDGAGWVNFVTNTFNSNNATRGGAISYTCPIQGQFGVSGCDVNLKKSNFF